MRCASATASINSQRTKHGALLDSLLLAGVYVELLGERQATLGLNGQGSADMSLRTRAAEPSSAPRHFRPAFARKLRLPIARS